MMLMLSTLVRQRSLRDIWLYDTFSGMTEPEDVDAMATSGQLASVILETTDRNLEAGIWAVSPLEDVRRNLERPGYPEELIQYVIGDVVETVRKRAPSTIALLRLDTHWYRSTRAELEHLYDKVSSGGVVIIDDDGFWTGARKAVDDFLADRGEAVLLTKIDSTVRMWIKP